MISGSHALQEFTFTSKYARYMSEHNRRENWKESINRVRQMMLRKYADKGIDDTINLAYDSMYKKHILGSQRMLQYGGKPVEKNNSRGYNCCGSYTDRLRFFQETFWLLLCGCGTGYNNLPKFTKKIPEFNSNRIRKTSFRNKTYQIPDTIEGWADSLGVLLTSYFSEPADERFIDYMDCDVEFDTSLIRPEGSLLSSGVGKAPGPKPLLKSLSNIRNLLDRITGNGQRTLKAVDVCDISCHASDAVLSGGVRRSSTLCLFDKDDDEMLKFKTGNWRVENPQRSRVNISALLLRNKVSYEEFQNIFQYTKQYGEPGFIWADDEGIVLNPCQPGWAKVLTPGGIKNINCVNIGDFIWSADGWTKIVKKWSTGINKVYKYETTAGRFFGTENHKIVTNGVKTPIKNAESIDILRGFKSDIQSYNCQSIMDGLLLGDGTVHRASNNLILLNIGKNDQDYFTSEIAPLIIKKRPGVGPYVYEVQTELHYTDIPLTFDRKIPNKYIYSSYEDKCSFLRGLYSANSSICGGRITLKSSSKQIIEDTQLLLSSVGIKSYYTTNSSKNIKFINGIYTCKQSYDLNITIDINIFAINIGFIQKYKTKKLNSILANKTKKINQKTSYEIISTKLISEEETFDITVDNQSHTYWTEGCNVSNCGEACLYPIDIITDKTGWSFCNLSSVNCGNIESEEDFYERCVHAAVVGTLQAGFNKFNYLGETSENICKKEALLGVSINGVMEHPEITLNPELQKKGAEIIKKTNAEIAIKIGINPAARTTVLKPDGTVGCLLGTSSGVHPHHAKRYLRRVQNNINETPFQYFKKHNPHMVEKSVWNNHSVDENIIFPVEVPDGAKLKNQMPALELLSVVKNLQQNWITAGRNPKLCLQPWLNHSVSNTITVKDNEWDDVAHYIYDNREFFSGVSLLSSSGDKDYPQAPFTAVFTSREITREYGDAAIWTSGLIELCLSAFDNNLWKACDIALLDPQQFMHDVIVNAYKEDNAYSIKSKLDQGIKQADCIHRMLKFAKKYFEGDIKRLTYCMKDVYNWKLYCDISNSIVKVDYTLMYESADNTTIDESISCVGGACHLSRTL